MIDNIPANVLLSNEKTLIRGGSIYSLCLSKGSIRVIFKCSAKVLPLDLDTISKKLGLPKKKKIDHSSINQHNFNDLIIKKNVENYCERDVMIVNNFMIKILSCFSNLLKNSLNFYSISGIAVGVFKEKFNFFNISLKLSSTLDKIVRKAYYGGRCEVFGNAYSYERVFHFDFSGMYSNRLKEKYPIGEAQLKKEVNTIKDIGFYKVSIESNLNLPILPYRDPTTGKLLFPNGNFTGIYWCEELTLFVENGGIIKKIHWCLSFKNEDYIFKSFAEACIDKRNENLVSQLVWKMIPNSFIGRIGLKPENEETVILNNSTYDPLDNNIISDRKINNIYIVRRRLINTEKPKVNSNVIYPAIVTSKARILWWKNAKEVTHAGGRLLYCDTDSFFVSFKRDVSGETHKDIFWDPNKADTFIEKSCFVGSKIYSIITKENKTTKIKGISNKKTQLSFEEFEKLFYKGDKKKLKVTHFNMKKFMKMSINEIEKIIDFAGYDKRKFSRDKKKTTSLVINEDTLCNDF